MTNFEQCAASKKSLIEMMKVASSIDPETLPYIDWDKWVESDSHDPVFKNAIPGQYSPTRRNNRWYDCIIINQDKTILGQPAALIWTLAGDHVDIVILKEHLRYG